jgi:hypothetical protein
MKNYFLIFTFLLLASCSSNSTKSHSPFVDELRRSFDSRAQVARECWLKTKTESAILEIEWQVDRFGSTHSPKVLRNSTQNEELEICVMKKMSGLQVPTKDNNSTASIKQAWDFRTAE